MGLPAQFEDRWYQAEAVDAIFDFFERNRVGNPVVAMPTGTGKSVVIARFLERVFKMYRGQRIMMLTHVKELIAQNAAKLTQIWPTAPLGIYSAGLKQKQALFPITFGGVLSVRNCIPAFGHIDLLLIDECHLLSPEEDTVYQAIIAEILRTNPYMRVIGFTATPFRMKMGMITDGGIFTHICYDITDFNSFNRLVFEGYLAPLVTKRGAVQMDMKGVSSSGGDFNKNQMGERANAITEKACEEIYTIGQSRLSWLLFASSIKNAEFVRDIMRNAGVEIVLSHSKLHPDENDENLKAFKSGQAQALVNMSKYTTGFDHTPTDLIGMIRKTKSPGMLVQIAGRGTRTYDPARPGDVDPIAFPSLKRNCVFLDYGSNCEMHGPINDIRIPNKPGKGGGDMPIRICKEGWRMKNGEKVWMTDGCDCYNHPKIRFCENCGMEFKFDVKIEETSSEVEVMRGDAKQQIERYDVHKTVYSLHTKEGKPPSIKVTYWAGLLMFSEWVCLEHPGAVSKRARQWWRQRMGQDPPATTYEALQQTSQLREPVAIRVDVAPKYPEILSHEF